MSKDTHGEKGQPWTGFDLDGTLAEYHGWKGIEHIGKPVKRMCDIAKKLHSQGKLIKIFTARVAPSPDHPDTSKVKKYIEDWCQKNLGFVPPITYKKDALMEDFYDDRPKQVIPNTGIEVEEAARQALELDGKDRKNSPEVKALLDYLKAAGCAPAI